MKQIAALLFALIATVSQAGVFAYAKNKGDGLLVLTDEKCTSDTGLVAYSSISNAPTMFGCWTIDDLYVFIRWNDGDTRSYPNGLWTVMQKKKGTAL